MSHRRAKRIRKAVLPTVRKDTGVSRGKLIRDLTSYDIVADKFLVLSADCPRRLIQEAKKNVKL